MELRPDGDADPTVLRRWHERCVGTPELVEGSGTDYELRSAWACHQHGFALIGTKAGTVYRVAKEGPISEVARLGSGVHAVHGCDRCDAGTVLAGGEDGQLWALARSEDPEDPRLCVRELDGKALKLSGKVRAVNVVAREARPETGLWGLIADEEHNLVLVSARDPSRFGRAWLPRSARWIVRDGHPPDLPDTHEDRWTLVSLDGHLARARVTWRSGAESGDPGIEVQNTGRLRMPPVWVASDRRHHRPGQRLRSILYGTDEGLRAALLDRDGVRAECWLTREGRVQYARILNIFGVPHLVVCEEGGRLRSRRWEHPEDSRDALWTHWPRSTTDVLFVHVFDSGHAEPRADALVVLRDHTVRRLHLSHLDRTREEVRAFIRSQPTAPEAEPASGSRAADERAFAALTTDDQAVDPEAMRRLVLSGGERALDGAVRRLARPPNPSHDQALAISADVLVAASALEAPAARAVATRLSRSLFVHLRDHKGASPENGGSNARQPRSDSEGRRRLERWAALVRKLFVMGHTYSEKRLRLGALVDVNRERRPIDALVYDARLAHQGFDVLWERELTSPVMDMAATTVDGSTRVGLTSGSGDVEVWTVQASALELGASRGGNPDRPRFGAYSRVILAPVDRGVWRVAPRKPNPGQAMLSIPPFETETETGSYRHQVYSMLDSYHGRVVLGVRDIAAPLQIWDPGKGTAEPVESRWGPILPERSAVKAGIRRVWGLARLDPTTLAVASEDGYLRVGSIVGACELDEIAAAEGPWRFRSSGVWYLGAAVRALSTTWRGARKDGRRREFLAAGTTQGEVFCFAWDAGGDQRAGRVDPVLKFRDVLEGGVAALRFSGGDSGTDEQLLVLDTGGRMTTYELGTRNGGFLGRRAHQYHVAEGATTFALVGSDRVLVAGWDEARLRGALRLVRLEPYRRSSDYRGRGPQFTDDRVEQAVRAIEEAGFADRARALNLLAAIPLDDPSLKARLVGARLGEDLSESRIRELRTQALRPGGGHRAEVKALLEAIHRRLRHEPDDRAAEVLRAAHTVLIEPSRRENDLGQRDPKLRALVVRRLLNARTLQLWKQAGLRPADLSRWVQDHVQHRDRMVRVETFRALAEALGELVAQGGDGTDPRALDSVFPPRSDESGGRPSRLGGAAWLLNALVNFLYAHPISSRAGYVDASTWSAVSVLVNVLRALEDDVLAVLDHLSVNGVDPGVFGLLRERMNTARKGDAEIRSRIDLYSPSWPSGESPSVQDVLGHCRRVMELRAEDYHGLDRDYVAAIKVCYGWFRSMAEAINLAGLRALCQALRAQPDDLGIKGFPETGAADLEHRKHFFEYTVRWMGAMARRMPSSPEAAEREWRAAIDEELGRLRGGRADEPLFTPEVEIARAVMAHWRQVLDPPLPAEGRLFGGYVLGPPIPGHQLVFEVKDKQDELLAVAWNRDPAHIQALARTWGKVRQRLALSGERGAPILEVIELEGAAGIRMRRLDGPNLEADWEHVRSLEPRQRYELAYRCAIDVGRTLAALHEVGVYHGDVRASNIVWTGGLEDPVFHLVDYDHAGDEDLPDGVRYLYSTLRNHYYGDVGAALRERARGTREDLRPTDQQMSWDTAALLHLTLKMVARSPLDRDFRGLASTRLPGESDALWRDVRDVLTSWSAKESKSEWSVDLLVSQLASRGRGLFICGASEDCRAHREEAMKERGADWWACQGNFEGTGRETLDVLLTSLRRCAAVVYFAGRAPGRKVPAVPDYIVGWARAHLAWTPPGTDREERWQAEWVPTWTQCEVIQALFDQKPLHCFSVGGALTDPVRAEDPSQRVLLGYLKERRFEFDEATPSEVPGKLHKRLPALLRPHAFAEAR